MGSYLVYGFAAFILISVLLQVGLGIGRLLNGHPISENGESVWLLLLRWLYDIGIAALLVCVYYFEILDWFWSIIMMSLLSLPVAIYVYWQKSN